MAAAERWRDLADLLMSQAFVQARLSVLNVISSHARLPNIESQARRLQWFINRVTETAAIEAWLNDAARARHLVIMGFDLRVQAISSSQTAWDPDRRLPAAIPSPQPWPGPVGMSTPVTGRGSSATPPGGCPPDTSFRGHLNRSPGGIQSNRLCR